MGAKRLRILVIEDHLAVREGLGAFLDMLGHHAEFAEDAASALAVARDNKFDALLTDIRLPGKDGWAVLRELRERGQLPPLTISMSAFNTGKEVARSKAAGCVAHLTKPFKPGELEAALRAADRPTA